MQQINDLAPPTFLRIIKDLGYLRSLCNSLRKDQKFRYLKRIKKTVLNPHGNFVFINETLKNSEVEILIGDKIKFPSSSTYFEAIKIEN